MLILFRILQGRAGRGIPKVRRRATTPRLEMMESRALLATFTVTNTSPDHTFEGSLPYVLFQANHVSQGLDYIEFDIPGADVVHSIVLTTQLFLVDQVVIDGTSQPGYDGRPLIYVQGLVQDGGGIPSIPTLFTLTDNPNGPLGATSSSGSTIQGLGMFSYSISAVTISAGSTGNWVQRNWVGFYSDGAGDPSLTSGGFDSADGLHVGSSFNTIRENTISGVRNGVVIGLILGPATSESVTNSVQTNNIGTDPTGSTSAGYGNLADGILLGDQARLNWLGPDNVISGNASDGVELRNSTTSGNVVFRSKIGTDKAGDAAIGNGGWGVLLVGEANGNAVGGPFGGNVISANALGGVSLGASGLGGASLNWVQYNNIGLNGGRTGAPSGGKTQNVGLSIAFGSHRNAIEQNIVAGQAGNGIFVEASESNYLWGNYVGENGEGVSFANGGIGVVLMRGASRNFLLSTAYGSNGQGNLFVDAGAEGNEIG